MQVQLRPYFNKKEGERQVYMTVTQVGGNRQTKQLSFVSILTDCGDEWIEDWRMGGKLKIEDKDSKWGTRTIRKPWNDDIHGLMVSLQEEKLFEAQRILKDDNAYAPKDNAA